MHAAVFPSHVPHALDLALLSIGVLGFRHGFDYDHLAAITDITASQQGGMRRAMAMGFAYISGHAATVAVLASVAILSRLSLPAGFDRWTERLVGLTLVVLGCYVLGSFARLLRRGPHTHGPGGGHAHRMPTRITLLINGVLWLVWRIRQSFSHRPVPRRRVFADGYGGRSSFVVGVIHGLGAETPSQILLFLLTANLGGMAKGFLGLGVFLAGLVVMNTLMCATATGVFGAGRERPRLMRTATLLTAAYSLAVGILFLAGGAPLLPVLG